MNDKPTTVLLAGEATLRSATLRTWLSQGTCQCQLVASFRDACRALAQSEFDLVLCQYDLPDRTGFPLLDWLEGSSSTLVFANAGKGSRWLPMIERGKRRLDLPLLRTTDLPAALGKMLDHNPRAGENNLESTPGIAPGRLPEIHRKVRHLQQA